MALANLSCSLRSRLLQQQQVGMCACAAPYSSHTKRTQLKDRLNTGPDLGEYGTGASSSIYSIVFTVKYPPPLPPTGPSNAFAPMKSIMHGAIRIIGQ
jgi:hypothetical protein